MRRALATMAHTMSDHLSNARLGTAACNLQKKREIACPNDQGSARAAAKEALVRNETAILAGGCFWGAQELLRHQPGVISTRVGYSGGDTPNPHEDNLGDHAEAVEILYDADADAVRIATFWSSSSRSTIQRS
jgi:hypothetical protein